MAKYYLNKNQFPVGADHTYFAVSDTPSTKRMQPYHPSATITVRHTPASATPRLDFTREHDLSSSVSKGVRERVNKDIGVPDADRVLEGRAGTAYQFVAYAADRTLEAHRIAREYGEKGHREFARKEGIDYAKQVRNIRNTPNELFDTDQPSTSIVYASSHSKMRHTIPLMAAHAHQKFGDLTASEDLSPHSSKMVKHAKKLNLPIGTDTFNENAEVTNSMDFDDTENSIWNGEMASQYTQIPDAEMASAKKHYKTLRRAGKAQPTNMSPQFEQLRLPGMEN